MNVSRPVLFALLMGLVASRAQTNVVALHPVSLRDCLSAALAHNFDIAIAQQEPAIARFDLTAAYGGQYDPLLAFNLQRDFTDMPSNFDSKKSGMDYPYQETVDTFGMRLSGRLTPGLAYEVAGTSIADSAFTDFSGIGLPVRYTNAYGAVLLFKLRQSMLRDAWVDAGRLRIQVNRQNLKFSRQALRLQVMRTVLDVDKAYFDLISAKDAVKVARQAVALAQELLDRDRKLVAASRLPPLGERLAQSEFESARAALLAAEDILDNRRNALRLLTSADLADSPQAYPDPIDGLVAVPEHADRADVWQQALTHRPELIQARIELEKQGLLVRYRRNQMLPALDLVGSFGGQAIDPRSRGNSLDTVRSFDHPIYGAGLVLTFPLANTEARNQYRASQAVKRQALLRLRRLEQTVFVEVDDVVQSLDRTFQRVGAARLARAYAEAALQSEKTRLEVGASTTFIVDEYERNLVVASAAETQAIADYNKALDVLAFNEGTLLERHHLQVDFK